MKTKKFLLTILAITLVLGVTLAGCSAGSAGGGGGGGGSPPEVTGPINPPVVQVAPPEAPSHIDAYSELEQVTMESNPSRAATLVGYQQTIEIPDYLLSESRAAAATFRVHNDDRSYATIVSSDATSCKVKGLRLGSARIIIKVGTQEATVILAVAPETELYTLPARDEVTIGTTAFRNRWWTDVRPDSLPTDIDGYIGDPTYQLAYKWRNPTTTYGASGTNCGIDLLAYYVDPAVPDRRGWVRTTYGFGGWHYDLNGVTNVMENGVQQNGAVRLELTPTFVYDSGVPYLQIKHKLTNTGTTPLTNQKFGASADIMIIGRDNAPLTYIPSYGALMTNGYTSGGTTYLPTLKFRLFLLNYQNNGVDDVSTIWLGRYSGERNYVYENSRTDVNGVDSALNFSYQNIDLAVGQSKEFVIRFTQAQ
jgi:hypothetical protein